MLETDVPETPNEMIFLTRKMGRIGLIGVYAGYTNHFAIGSLMEKGIRFIGNGQAPGGSTAVVSIYAKSQSTFTGRKSSTTTSLRANSTPPL
jgi:threonine dehydrogenase-like Zn-dependent dehydrogenase